MKCVGSSPRQQSTWPWPRGKYQMSPGSKSFVSAQPCGSMTVVRTRPEMTNAHSAAVACQCSSRIAPGSRIIETPAMPLEIGSCSTVASRPTLPPITLPSDFSSSNLKVGNSLPDRSGSGSLMLLMERQPGYGEEVLSADEHRYTQMDKIDDFIWEFQASNTTASAEIIATRHHDSK